MFPSPLDIRGVMFCLRCVPLSCCISYKFNILLYCFSCLSQFSLESLKKSFETSVCPGRLTLLSLVSAAQVTWHLDTHSLPDLSSRFSLFKRFFFHLKDFGLFSTSSVLRILTVKMLMRTSSMNRNPCLSLVAAKLSTHLKVSFPHFLSSSSTCSLF